MCDIYSCQLSWKIGTGRLLTLFSLSRLLTSKGCWPNQTSQLFTLDDGAGTGRGLVREELLVPSPHHPLILLVKVTLYRLCVDTVLKHVEACCNTCSAPAWFARKNHPIILFLDMETDLSISHFYIICFEQRIWKRELHQLLSYLTENSMLSNFQSGLRPSHSTVINSLNPEALWMARKYG